MKKAVSAILIAAMVFAFAAFGSQSAWADSGEERLEKAVRYALGVEPYPPRYPE